MKKYICILLISWMPLFIASANAMSLQMFVDSQAAATQAHCHQDTQKDVSHDKAAHKCVLCGFCTIAASSVIFCSSAAINLTMSASAEPVFMGKAFNSLHHTPAIKPPISA